MIEHIRFTQTKTSTASRLFVDGQQVCYLLEDGHNDPVIKGITRIPAGSWQIRFRREGKFYGIYTKRFGSGKEHPMIEIVLPGWKYVMIHCGNTVEDTLGCPLTGDEIGKHADPVDGQQFYIPAGKSTQAYLRMHAAITPLLHAAEAKHGKGASIPYNVIERWA